VAIVEEVIDVNAEPKRTETIGLGACRRVHLTMFFINPKLTPLTQSIS
jgi:hypothetical protein